MQAIFGNIAHKDLAGEIGKMIGLTQAETAEVELFGPEAIFLSILSDTIMPHSVMNDIINRLQNISDKQKANLKEEIKKIRKKNRKDNKLPKIPLEGDLTDEVINQIKENIRRSAAKRGAGVVLPRERFTGGDLPIPRLRSIGAGPEEKGDGREAGLPDVGPISGPVGPTRPIGPGPQRPAPIPPTIGKGKIKPTTKWELKIMLMRYINRQFNIPLNIITTLEIEKFIDYVQNNYAPQLNNNTLSQFIRNNGKYKRIVRPGLNIGVPISDWYQIAFTFLHTLEIGRTTLGQISEDYFRPGGIRDQTIGQGIGSGPSVIQPQPGDINIPAPPLQRPPPFERPLPSPEPSPAFGSPDVPIDISDDPVDVEDVGDIQDVSDFPDEPIEIKDPGDFMPPISQEDNEALERWLNDFERDIDRVDLREPAIWKQAQNADLSDEDIMSDMEEMLIDLPSSDDDDEILQFINPVFEDPIRSRNIARDVRDMLRRAWSSLPNNIKARIANAWNRWAANHPVAKRMIGIIGILITIGAILIDQLPRITTRPAPLPRPDDKTPDDKTPDDDKTNCCCKCDDDILPDDDPEPSPIPNIPTEHPTELNIGDTYGLHPASMLNSQLVNKSSNIEPQLGLSFDSGIDLNNPLIRQNIMNDAIRYGGKLFYPENPLPQIRKPKMSDSIHDMKAPENNNEITTSKPKPNTGDKLHASFNSVYEEYILDSGPKVNDYMKMQIARLSFAC